VNPGIGGSVERYMRTARCLMFSTVLALTACATVSTEIVELKPAQKYPPTQSVEVLLEKPTRPHVEIALIESRGGSEATMLNDAREKARALGADALVKLETERLYHQPIAVYDPWYDPFYWGFHPHSAFAPFPHPWGPYRVVGGGYSYVLKTLAVKYSDGVAADKPPPPK
jgi:hypothetical protein